jgi:hypothetical protein
MPDRAAASLWGGILLARAEAGSTDLTRGLPDARLRKCILVRQRRIVDLVWNREPTGHAARVVLARKPSWPANQGIASRWKLVSSLAGGCYPSSHYAARPELCLDELRRLTVGAASGKTRQPDHA